MVCRPNSSGPNSEAVHPWEYDATLLGGFFYRLTKSQPASLFTAHVDGKSHPVVSLPQISRAGRFVTCRQSRPLTSGRTWQFACIP